MQTNKKNMGCPARKKPYFCGFMRVKSIIVGLIMVLLLPACGNYGKLLKSGTIEQKLNAANAYYAKKDYAHALGLFEQLLGYYSGQTEQEKIQYYIAYCNYGQGSLDLASYLFQSFYETYPNSIHAEECLYMFAYCHYLNSQGPELDQTNTLKAINELQLYINQYPESKRVAEANTLIDKLREVLAEKAYLHAMIYFKTQEYKAAIVCIKNVLKDWPELPQREELEFIRVKAHFLLAENSIEVWEKDDGKQFLKKERYESTIEACKLFKSSYPTSKYNSDVENFNRKSTAGIIEQKKFIEQYTKSTQANN
jgi:outer membrane protein assembly factor BamD